ncbi:hypothetical protein HOE04_01455 [archaeon]|jgi:hypothetical protein|nr:hypothetical protein [archaeon]
MKSYNNLETSMNSRTQETSKLKSIIDKSLPILIISAGVLGGGMIAQENGGPAGTAIFGISALTAIGYTHMASKNSNNY